MLKQALEIEPDYLEAYVHLALVYARTGQAEQAEAAIAEASRRHPSEAEMLGRLLDEIRTAASEPLPAGDAHPDVPAPPPSRASAPPAAASAGPGYAGQIQLDAGFSGTIAPGAVIFLTVREQGYATGAPNAAKRLPIGSFPMAFSVSAGDSMMGGELPESARIEARVDSDGDVMSRDPQDPIAVLDGVPLGAEDIELVLRVP
jgi:Tetratricopeptide repeat